MRHTQNVYDIQKEQATVNSIAGAVDDVLDLDLGSAVTAGYNWYSNEKLRDENLDYYIRNAMAQIKQRELMPNTPSVGQGSATIIGYQMLMNEFMYNYSTSIKDLERIDKYLGMYGYSRNQIESNIDINSRKYFNYIKTIDVILETTDIPNDDKEILKQIFNVGVTLWHDPTHFKDYSVWNLNVDKE